MSWFVISNTLVLHFRLNSYIQNLYAPDTKEKICLLLSPWKILWKQFQMLTDKNTGKWQHWLLTDPDSDL